MDQTDRNAVDLLREHAARVGIDLSHARIRRTSSRFCLGVEHGDYNGTELFGIGTDRFIWLAFVPNTAGRFRFFSVNFPDDGLVELDTANLPAPRSEALAHSWARFPAGVLYVLQKHGFALNTGLDAVLYGNIPGGGMSRSASLSLNLILSVLDANNLTIDDPFCVVDLAQQVENEYIGSPCGQLDQIMILFAKAGMGTHYNPKEKSISYVPLGPGGADLRFVVMDTGTDRPGLDKSTYKIRRDECEQLVSLAKNAGFKLASLADVRNPEQYAALRGKFAASHPHLAARLKYIYEAQQRFYQMMDAWKAGDMAGVGEVFRRDGIGLRDDYAISGPELETMCDIVRTVPGVFGERMLGGGDKGAAGALVRASAVEALGAAVDTAYPRSRPDYAGRYAVHVCKLVDGVTTLA